MLKILVAEDEKLVRKGIIGLIDWKKYDSEVVGEASNGQSALEFLACHHVDILMTDLTMPGVCGIEYLEQVRAAFPNIYIIVLTMHREFEIIQKALRLDIVDYMTKDQIEKDEFEESLVNILKKIKKEKIEAGRNKHQRLFCIWDEGIVVTSLEGEDLEELLGEDKYVIEEGKFLAQESYLIPFSKETVTYIERLSKKIYGIKLQSIRGVEYRRIKKQIDKFKQIGLFYLYRPERKVYEIEEEKFQKNKHKDWERVLKQFESNEWIIDDAHYKQSLIDLENLQLSGEELTVFVYQLYIGWTKYTGYEMNRYFESISMVRWWYEWQVWFEENRKMIKKQLYSHSNEILNDLDMHKAIKYIESHYQENILLEDILKEVGMSKSHFSRVFKEITGCTFIHYLNAYRIEKAKNLLRETSYTHFKIAEYVGFTSERYFRKVFIEKVGMKPTEFRKRLKKT